jgi:hypothetical protein
LVPRIPAWFLPFFIFRFSAFNGNFTRLSWQTQPNAHEIFTTQRRIANAQLPYLGVADILSRMNARYRPVIFAVAALMAVWLAALGGYALSDHFKMTADKLRAYIQGTDLSKLSGEARAKALRDLADKINALSPEERRQARVDRLWSEWFGEMTEEEKGRFLDATLPSNFHQMLVSFEQQPPEKRQKAIDDAIKQLRQARENPSKNPNNSDPNATNGPPVLSEDLQKKVTTIGLNSVYSTSSAETKAELAPLLEEIQKNMESGRMFRGGR